MKERGVVRKISDPKLGEVEVPGMPLRFSAFEHNQHLETAALGEHNCEVLNGLLKYSSQKTEELNESGVLYRNNET
jgi:crotonobetainyl-CoA:carnitine CoA-transferase CaiB-like acyl-CoA transferase